jgi:N4-gp56 family major capsid protein
MKENSLTTLTIENKVFYEKALLKRLKSEAILYKYGKKAVLPRHHGNTISWRKFLKFKIPTAPLTEGVTPEPLNKMQPVEFNAKLKQYGDYIEITDLLDFEGIDPILTEASEAFGEQIAETKDALIRKVLLEGINVYFGGKKTSRDALTAKDTLTLDDLNRMKTIMRKYNVKPVENGKYLLLVSPEVQYDLIALTNETNSFIDIAKYAKTESILDGEVGTILGFKIIVDNFTSSVENASGVVVHQCIALGKDAFGVVDLEGDTNSPRLIHKPLGSGGTNDPIDQIQTLGWKINGFATRILYDEAVMRVEVASGINVSSNEITDEKTRTHFVEMNNE